MADKKRITNIVNILFSGKVLFHVLNADNYKQTGVNHTEYIQNETLRLSFDFVGKTSCNQTCSVFEHPL